MSGSIFFYGPPGSGKSTTGKILAKNLNLSFHDLDGEIEIENNKTISQIFEAEGEAGFRRLESAALERLISEDSGVIALGGGALLDHDNRSKVEKNGSVLVLDAPLDVIQSRIAPESKQRPLLAGEMPSRLANLLSTRAEHYASFKNHIDTSNLSSENAAWQAQKLLGQFHVKGMGAARSGTSGGYDVLVRTDSLDDAGQELTDRGLKGPIVLVTDGNVGPLYADRVLESLHTAGFTAVKVEIPSDEEFKTIMTINNLWDAFLQNELDRSSTVIALGGGVVSDLAGFAAATYLRGIRWVVMPTTLLSMADASLGGKTGADLPTGKNLIGAFHPPSLVLADPSVLATLPERELRGGFAEIIKHGVISDTRLFDACKNLALLSEGDLQEQPLEDIVKRAMAVKIAVIEEDPYEKGIRAVLNAGHTIGHAIELASGFRISHGEAVAIGLVVEARMGEEMGITRVGLSEEISEVLAGIGLPTQVPAGFGQSTIEQAIFRDKKRAGESVNFAMPVEIGQARFGISLTIEDLRSSHAFHSCFTRT